MAKGYGAMIRAARESAAMSVEELAERLDRSVSTVRRMESEGVEPSVAQVNILVATLPLSAEQLLRAMGVQFTPSAVSRLPQELVRALLEATPEQLAAVSMLIAPQSARSSRRLGEAS